MKIAFVLRAFPVVSETFIVNQICSLIDLGHDVKIFTFEFRDEELIHPLVKEYELLNRLKVWQKIPRSKSKRVKVFLRILGTDSENVNGRKVLKTINFFKYGKKAISLEYFFKCQWFLGKNEFDVIHGHFAPMIVDGSARQSRMTRST